MNQNEPAYPTNDVSDANGIRYCNTGLTKRELIAAMCLQGLMTRYTQEQDSPIGVACESVIVADALLTELAKEQT